jgi:5'-nucleotidase
MKKSIRLFSILLICSIFLAPTSASAGKADPPGQLVRLQLLAFNDYHGHVLPNDAGNVDGVPAGGGEYLSAKLKQLRSGNKYTVTVAAGDLIGGSPAFSGLFHD